MLALDARIIIHKDLALGKPKPYEHLVIEPYPREYVEEWKLDDGRSVTIRPVRPEDEPLVVELWETFSEAPWQYQFFGDIKEVTHEDLVRFTNIDYRRTMIVIGELKENGERKMIGICGFIIYPEENTGQFGVVVGNPWQGLGLGEKLLDSIIGIAKDKGLKAIWTTPQRSNESLIKLCEKLGFEIEIEEESENLVRVTLKL